MAAMQTAVVISTIHSIFGVMPNPQIVHNVHEQGALL